MNKIGKMERAQRAKQFMPFDALKGLREALIEKERVIVSKKILSEEQKGELDYNLYKIAKGSMIIAEYFQEGQYVQVTGIVSKVNQNSKTIQMIDKEISFDDIIYLECLKENM